MKAKIKKQKSRSHSLNDLKEQDDLNTKVSTSLSKLKDRPLKILNLRFPINLKNTRIALDKERYDLILNINYAELSRHTTQQDLLKIIEQISNNSSISIFHFSSFNDYFRNLLLKKIYKYREIIPTYTQTIFVFCSNSYWYANGHMAEFEQPQNLTREWVGKVDGTRRYYFNSEYILKYYQLTEKIGIKITKELKREIRFLKKNNEEQGFAPQMIGFYMGSYEGWVLRKKVPGTPLSEIIENNLPYDPCLILKNIFQQSIYLEKNNYYHTDLRPRNVLVLNSGEAMLIDYGAVERKKKRYLPGYFSHIMFGYEVFHKKNIPIRKFDPAYVMHNELNSVYHRWLKLIISVPNEHWTFPLFQHFLEEAQNREPVCRIDYDNFQFWLTKIHKLINARRIRLKRFEVFMAKKLNHYFYKPSPMNLIMNFLWQKSLVLYDSISLPIKSLFIQKKGI